MPYIGRGSSSANTASHNICPLPAAMLPALQHRGHLSGRQLYCRCGGQPRPQASAGAIESGGSALGLDPVARP